MAMPVVAEESDDSLIGGTRNTDLAGIYYGGPWQSYVYPPLGSNMKVHVNITSIFGTIYIYCKPYSGDNLPDSAYLVATWTGEGHHWADLALNTTAYRYYVYLYGDFSGSGAVYTEP